MAEVDNEVRGYIDLLARPWQRLGWVANMAVDPMLAPLHDDPRFPLLLAGAGFGPAGPTND